MPKTKTRAVIQRNGKILVMQNADRDEYPDDTGLWELPGGTVKNGEALAETLEREVQEETGLTVTDTTKIEQVSVQQETGKTRHYHFYHVQVEDGEVELSDEHMAYRWIMPAAFKQLDWKRGAGYCIPLLKDLEEQ